MNLLLLAQLQDWKEITTDPTTGQTTGCLVDGVPTLKCLEVAFGNILFISAALSIVILFIMFVIGAFYYLTSFGNPERVKKAQGTLKFALIGFILFIGSYVILKSIDCLFLGCQGQLFNLKIGE